MRRLVAAQAVLWVGAFVAQSAIVGEPTLAFGLADVGLWSLSVAGGWAALR